MGVDGRLVHKVLDPLRSTVFVAFLGLIFATSAAAQSRQTKPDLSEVTPEQRRAMEGACSGKKSLWGPAAYYQCLREQLEALSRAPHKPELSGVTPEERGAMEGACSGKKSLWGPAAYYQCLREQLEALSREPHKPDLSEVTREERRAMEGACAGKKSLWGPAAYYQCLREQLEALSREPHKPDLSGVTPEERQAMEGACAGKKSLWGPAAYYQCLREQLGALGEPTREPDLAAPPVYRTPAPRTAPPRPSITDSQSRVSQRRFRWPAWSAGLSGAPPKSLSDPFEPAALFKRVSSSVYVVLAASSRERLLSKSGVYQGSAIAVSNRNLITNCHILENTSFIVVAQNDSVAEAKLSKANPGSDRCVLQVTGQTLSPVPGVRPYENLAVGERVYSIGAPSGLEKTLGEGLISGLRDYKGIKFIQTSAPVSPGSSGGGLFDSSGNLIGITTFILEEAQSLNFAIAAQEYWR